MGTIMVVCSEDGQKISGYLRRLAPPLLDGVELAMPRGARTEPQKPVAAAVVDSSDPAALDWVCRQKLPAITCGFHNRDTLTLSSITPDAAVICLLRALQTTDGRVIEPMEFPVSLDGRPAVYPILACSAVMLLYGMEERLLTAKFCAYSAKPNPSYPDALAQKHPGENKN